MAAQLEHTDKSSEPGCLSFKDLADVLSAQKSVPSLAQLDELIDRTKIGAEEVQPYLGFKAGNYSRHRVMKNEFVERLCHVAEQRTQERMGAVSPHAAAARQASIAAARKPRCVDAEVR